MAKNCVKNAVSSIFNAGQKCAMLVAPFFGTIWKPVTNLHALKALDKADPSLDENPDPHKIADANEDGTASGT